MAERKITTHKIDTILPVLGLVQALELKNRKITVVGLKQAIKLKVEKMIKLNQIGEENWNKAKEINTCIQAIDTIQNPEYKQIKQEYQKIISGEDTLVNLLRYPEIIGTEQYNINLFNEIVEEVSQLPGIGDVSNLKIDDVFDGAIKKL